MLKANGSIVHRGSESLRFGPVPRGVRSMMLQFDNPKTLPHVPIRCAVSGAMALCLVLYLLINHSFDYAGLVLIALGTAPWLVLFLHEFSFAGFVIRSQVQENTEDIRNIAMLMKFVLTKNELKWLFNLAHDKPVETNTRDKPLYEGFKSGIEHMRGLGFIKNKKDHLGFAELENEPKGPRDGRSVFYATDEGREFLNDLEKITRKTIAELLV
jgi:hypothetical protein